jgi:hypothetical protein
VFEKWIWRSDVFGILTSKGVWMKLFEVDGGRSRWRGRAGVGRCRVKRVTTVRVLVDLYGKGTGRNRGERIRGGEGQEWI